MEIGQQEFAHRHAISSQLPTQTAQGDPLAHEGFQLAKPLIRWIVACGFNIRQFEGLIKGTQLWMQFFPFPQMTQAVIEQHCQGEIVPLGVRGLAL